MKKYISRLLKILKCILCVLAVMIIVFFVIRAVGQKINSKTPYGGINESMYVDINDTKQWISIYGEDINNPVLLYLHGGPGSATSAYDYAFTRKWADVYTVVTWDQRNCGKSYDKSQNNTELTYDLMMSDGLAMTQYLINYLGKEKITLLGHSWGTYLGCNLVLEYPEYYDCYIGVGQMVDMYQNEVAFKEVASAWVEDDSEGLELIELLTPDGYTEDHFQARNKLMSKYGYDIMVDGTDYNLPLTIIFNPYYSLVDWWNYINSDYFVYMDFLMSEEFSKFSLINRTSYQMLYYNINGNRDYQTNYLLAEEYFSKVEAPYKELYIMENTTHGLLESKSNEFSGILHKIEQKDR